MPVHELLRLLARHRHLPRVRHDHVVTTVRFSRRLAPQHERMEVYDGLELTRRVKYRLVLAHEHEGDALCEFSEYPLGRVDVVPHSRIGKRSLSPA